MTRTHDWADVEGTARDLANNHASFDSFGWHDRPDGDQEWCICYTHHRDSGLVDLSNAAVIEREMEPFGEDVISQSHGHWAVGWIEGFVIRVYRDGRITDAFRKWCELQAAIEAYPVLDEMDLSNRQFEAALDHIRNVGNARADAPDDWTEQVYEWISENEDERELDDVDDQGPSPSDDVVTHALIDLDLLDAVYEVRIGDALHLETTSFKRASKEARTLEYHAGIGIGPAVDQEVTIERDWEEMDRELWA